MIDRDIDLLDGEFYANDPYPTYAWMREHAPVYWDATNELWGISRYDDIVEIEKHKERRSIAAFASGRRGAVAL